MSGICWRWIPVAIFSAVMLYNKHFMFLMPGRDPENFKTLICNIMMIKDSVWVITHFWDRDVNPRTSCNIICNIMVASMRHQPYLCFKFYIWYRLPHLKKKIHRISAFRVLKEFTRVWNWVCTLLSRLRPSQQVVTINLLNF